MDKDNRPPHHTSAPRKGFGRIKKHKPKKDEASTGLSIAGSYAPADGLPISYILDFGS